ncbi:MAG TPA: ribonuclease III [Spirochaetota bacterium]|nr:ribonuclease III [Spirochaetota bacterium]
MKNIHKEYFAARSQYYDKINKQLSEKRKKQLQEFLTNTNIKFNNLALLEKALTHKSYANERSRKKKLLHNQRMEFIGDNILGMIIAEYLFYAFPDFEEGTLSKIKSNLVSRKTLSQKAEDLGMGDYIRFGNGEIKNGAKAIASILEDTFESFIAAYYIDNDFNAVKRFIIKHFQEQINNTAARVHTLNFKSKLQEITQKRFKLVPRYNVDKTEGPDNKKKFFISVYAGKKFLAKGHGYSKREAEFLCAKKALLKLKKEII